MSSLLMVNPMKRKKQSYLLNPANPFEQVHVPAHSFKAFRSGKTGKFAKTKKRKNPLAKAMKKAFRKKVAKKISRKHVKRTIKRAVKRGARKAFRAKLAKPLAPRPGMIKLFGPSGSVLKSIKIRKGGSIMARRKHRKARKHINPFNLKKLSKGFVNTNLLMDGALVAGGMVASQFVMNFAASKIPYVATPLGKIISRVVLGSGVLMLAPKVGLKSRFAGPLALGFIAPAVVDAVSMVAPAGLLSAGSVKLLEAGYMPDVAQGTVSLEQGYMPDVQETSFGFSDN